MKALSVKKVGVHSRHFISRLAHIFTHPAFWTLTIAGNGSILLAATFFYQLEKDSNPSIHSFLDALWWSVTTVTTVGYGDVLPHTDYGKYLGMATMIFGSALFCSFTAFFASSIMTPQFKEMEKELQDVEKEGEDLQKLILRLEKTLSELKARGINK